MKVSEQIVIMKAYEDGKTIERTIRDESEWKSLEYVADYPFDFVLNEYRIATKPKYRPYKSVEEAFNEAKKHEFWTKEISTGFIINVGTFGENFENIYINRYNQNNFLDKFVWADDNSPCGIKIE
ncbi:MAG: hypothetical protein PUJ51_14425 [Clostridiales bacterium]|uniref:hypothetical protein n=1 Tax=Terrisporobacter sp. TaxID=1965305 RepID=UPI002A52814F|nr:hypothetical protein [Terrisporobacter sp.]MDD7755681.1 hypothetical protein [Clostridiales bacterium]MDY4135190.1 hypothetical protein [Terrisporobacter sp.]